MKGIKEYQNKNSESTLEKVIEEVYRIISLKISYFLPFTEGV